MPFNLYNISGIFQVFINITLYNFLNNFCIVYLDDILVYSNIEEEYIKYI